MRLFIYFFSSPLLIFNSVEQENYHNLLKIPHFDCRSLYLNPHLSPQAETGEHQA